MRHAGFQQIDHAIDLVLRTFSSLDFANQFHQLGGRECVCHAGYLIDHDERVAFVFGYPEFDPDGGDLDDLPRDEAAAVRRINAALMASPLAFLEHIAPHWTGWQLNWDDRVSDAVRILLSGREVLRPASRGLTAA